MMNDNNKSTYKICGIKCAVNSCTASRRSNPETKFFAFPSDKDLFNVWISKCGLNESNLPKRLQVCEKHFNPELIGKRKLKKKSVPEFYLKYQDLKTDGEVPERFQNINTYSIKPIDDVCSSAMISSFHEYDNISSTIMTEKENIAVTCNNCLVNIKNCFYYKRKYEESVKIIQSLKDKIVLGRKQKFNFNRLSMQRLKNKINQLRKKPLSIQIESLPNLSSHAKEFGKMILSKKPKEWPMEQKKLAQQIYFKSPSCYNFLREILNFQMPSKSSLCRWTLIKNLKPGINESILSALKNEVSSMDTKSKKIILIFDEVSIRRDLEYDTVCDVIDGFSQTNNDRFGSLAKYLTVFMIRGLLKPYKFMISYHATEKNMDGVTLSEVLLSTIKVLIDVGLEVIAIVCDQGPNNRKCYSQLGVTEHTPYFELNKHNIFALYDPPHLIKSVRNNLLSGDLETPDGIASWAILKELYEYEQNCSTKLCPKLTSRHIYPNAFEKMRVKLATQALSRTVAAGIKTMHEFGTFSDSCCNFALSTANFIEKIDRLFDNLNSRNLFHRNPQKCGLQLNSPVYTNLEIMLDYFQNIKPHQKKPIFCLTGMRQTIRGLLLMLQQLIQNSDVEYILTSRINQDPIEIFFGLIRQRGGNSNNPSIYDFNHLAAKIITMTFLENSFLTNCEADQDELLVTEFSNLPEQSCITSSLHDISNIDNTTFEQGELDAVIIETSCDSQIEKIDDSSLKYFIGYVAYKMLKKSHV